jgi:hypothetical protein
MKNMVAVKTRRRWTIAEQETTGIRWTVTRVNRNTGGICGHSFAFTPDEAADWAWMDGGKPFPLYTTKRAILEYIAEEQERIAQA